ncbi:MAG: hypothetical protein NT170_04565 [Candidatus Moranbacteria bacterium]|nr:hypothetical protein [Candidatus Moranbacteria bacterium]
MNLKLGYKTKGEFQAANFSKLAEKIVEGKAESGNVSLGLERLVEGLAIAYDKAEEYQIEEL